MSFLNSKQLVKRLRITLLFSTLIIGTLISQSNTITLQTKTGDIEGTLLFPSSQEKVPMVLIIAGSGPTDRNGNGPMMTNNSLKMLAEGLYGVGIASVRFDKRGIGQSRHEGFKEEELRFDTYVEDAKDWIDFLNKDPRFSNVIVLGHSEGSLIGMVAVQQKKVDKFISVAGVGEPAGDLLLAQIATQFPDGLERSSEIVERIGKGEMVDSIPLPLYPIFRPSVQPYLRSWFKYNPIEEMAKLDIPILILHGTHDIQVDASHATTLAAANTQVELHILEGMNHVLKAVSSERQENVNSYNDSDRALANNLLEVMVRFVYRYEKE